MPKLDITDDERTLVTDALDGAISSAKRQQNMKGKTITITEVWKQHERTLEALKSKINTAK